MMRTKYILMMILAMGVFTIATARVKLADEIIGFWKYTISDVPPEYESGNFTFEKKEDKVVGYIGTTERREMKELVVDQGKVTFAMDFEGGLIKYELQQKGDTLTGTVSTQYGDFPIKAIKEPAK